MENQINSNAGINEELQNTTTADMPKKSNPMLIIGIAFGVLILVVLAFFMGRQSSQPNTATLLPTSTAEKTTKAATITPIPTVLSTTVPTQSIVPSRPVQHLSINVQTQAPVPDDWKTYSNQYISFRYPSTWVVVKDKNTDAVYIHNPASIQQRPGNGDSTITTYNEFFDVTNVEKSTISAQTDADKYMPIPGDAQYQDVHRENASNSGIDYAILDEYGEGSWGRDLLVSNGIVLAFFNTSLQHLNGTSIENQILSSLQFLQ